MTPFRRVLTFLFRAAAPGVIPRQPTQHLLRLPMRKKSQRHRASRSSPAALNALVHPEAAAIDVGAKENVVAVPPGRAPEPVRTFSSFTAGVHATRDWLLACGIKTVALESTGNYWITLYTVLEEAGLEVCLVNARHIKGVPGRKKTDVCDAQWLQQLHQAGLLRRSFRPGKDITPLRYLMRHRGQMIAESSSLLLRMQKVLIEMNLQLHHVLSDLDGQSAQRILTAILAGERRTLVLAGLRDKRCRKPLSQVLAALQGDYREELLFVLQQSQDRRAQLARAIAECDVQIQKLCAAVPGEPAPTPAPSATTPTATASAASTATTAAPPSTSETAPAAAAPAPAKTKRSSPHKNAFHFPIQEEARRFYGVDLCTLDGVGPGTVATFMSEIGARRQLLEAFPSAGHFSSWLALCPDHRKTGGKIKGSKTRRVKNRVALALRMAAQAVTHSKGELGTYAMRLRGRLGKPEAITAVAHKLARVLYGMIASQTPYDEKIAFRVTPQRRARELSSLIKKAQKLGMQLVPAQ